MFLIWKNQVDFEIQIHTSLTLAENVQYKNVMDIAQMKYRLKDRLDVQTLIPSGSANNYRLGKKEVNYRSAINKLWILEN